MSARFEIPVPFAAARADVRPEWIDYNGHMNVGYFSVVFDIAADAFLEFLGFTQAFRSQHGSTTFALEQHLNFLREVNEGDSLRSAMPQTLLERLAAIRAAHAALERPWQIGHVLSVRPPARR
jgi:hypothetical protein